MKLFLDDTRDPSECMKYMHLRIGHLNPIYGEGGWFIVRNYDQFVEALQDYYEKITHVSFDHDLADGHYDESMYKGREEYEKYLQSLQERKGEKTGYECAKFLEEFYELRKRKRPTMFVHSMNPVGVERIISVFAK